MLNLIILAWWLRPPDRGKSREVEVSVNKYLRTENCLAIFIFGVHSALVTPVPIPNTVVKQSSVDGTWRAASRESREMPE